MGMKSVEPTAKQQIDEYIESVPEWARPVCVKLRAILLKADPGIVEAWKWGPHYEKDGMVCGFGAFKKHVALAFFKGSLLPDPKAILEKCPGTLNSRRLYIRSMADLDAKAITALVRAAIAVNAAGTKVPTKAPARVPADLKAALLTNGPAHETFKKLTPGYRRDYIVWITGAKRPETRTKRLETTIEKLAAGQTLNEKYQR